MAAKVPIAIKFCIKPTHKKMFVLFDTNCRMRGLITKIMPSMKNMYPLISVTLPGKNSIM